MYKNILFDLDGTLLDTRRGVISAVEITIRQLNLPMPSDEILKMFPGPPMQDSLKKYFNMDNKTALESANLFRANYNKYSLYEADLYDGIIELFEDLRKSEYKIAVATNKSHENAINILNHFGILKYCDYAMGSDLDAKLKKSDIIEECIKQLNAKKSETIMIGDSDADYKGANIANIDFLAVTYGFGYKNKEDLEGIDCVKVCPDVNSINKFFTEEVLNV